jgi:hypothetical protein
MFLTQLTAVTLVVAAAAAPLDEPRDGGLRQLSLNQKNTIVRPYQRLATDCIVREVAADRRFKENPANGLGDLIVELMPKCVGPMRAMIEAYDRNFGDGEGEKFFMGPYLDLLPRIVVERAADHAK